MRKILQNSDGRRVGQSHPQAKYADHEVDLLRELRDQGLSYGQIAEKMEMPRATVSSICQGRRRAQTVARVKVVKV